MTAKNKVIRNKNKEFGNYGIIGQSISDCDYKIGDLVLWSYSDEDGKNQRSKLAVVCFNDLSDFMHPFLMGWGSYDIRYQKEFKIEKVVLPAESLTEELLRYHHDSLEIADVPAVRLTMESLKELVGFDFELIEE